MHFTNIVQESRAIVMVGGTMQPVSSLLQLLVNAGMYIHFPHSKVLLLKQTNV